MNINFFYYWFYYVILLFDRYRNICLSFGLSIGTFLRVPLVH